MTQSIESYLKNLLTLLLLSLVSVGGMAQGIYQSPHHCIPDFNPGNSGGGGSTGGGATGGGAATGPTGCPVPSYFFDTDTLATSWSWNMGDINGSVLTGRSINFFYTTQGNYTISLTKETIRNGLPTTLTENINVSVGTYPQDPLFNDLPKTDTTVCGGNSVTLNPYRGTIPIGDYSYLWYPTGDTTRTIEVDSSGCYSVEVTNNNTGCSKTASITVNFCLQPAASGGGPEKWYFGNGATIEFQSVYTDSLERDPLEPEGSIDDTPEVDPESLEVNPVDNAGSNPLNSTKATAMVYGPSGALAFYTDGSTLYNGNDEPVTDAFGNQIINADTTASQGLVIIPKSNCNECPHHQYYVVYIDKDTKILSRATIDLRYNGGLGQVTETKVPIAYPVTEKITAVKNVDETGYVLISQVPNSNTFQFYSVDSSGVLGVSQNIGANKGSNSGYIATNLAGNKVAVGYVGDDGNNYIEVYDFNKETLELENPITIDLGYAAPPEVYGIEFSENGDFLYVTLRGDPTNGETSYLLQLPLILDVGSDIAANINIIDQSTTESFGALKLGPVNGPGSKYIYMAIDGASEIPYIQQPDIRGDATLVGYTRVTAAGVREGVAVSGTSQAGFPNVVYANQEQNGDGIQSTYRRNCFMAPTELTVEDVCSPLRNEVIWEFEDGTQIKGSPATYTFPKLGWNYFKLIIRIYNTSPLKGVVNNQVVNKLVELTETTCTEEIIEGSIFIKPSPVSNLADITYLCLKDLNNGLLPQDSIYIDPMASGGDTLTYNWFTATGNSIIGRGDAILYVAAPSIYKLELSNEFDCETKDETEVRDGCEPKLFLPEAFSPNGDSINDFLKIFYAHLTDFNLQVFNRWGELVFDTDQPETQWDGAVKGRVTYPTVYPYVVTYRSKDFPERGELKLQGTVWVLK